MFSPQVVISTPGFGPGHVRPARQYHGQSHLRAQRNQKPQRSQTHCHQPLRQQRRLRRPLSFAARRAYARTSMWLCFKSAIKSNRIAAVETNNADAAMLTPPMTLQARKLGMTLLRRCVQARHSLFQPFLRFAPALHLTKNRGRLGQLHQSDDRRRALLQIQQRIHHESVWRNI